MELREARDKLRKYSNLRFEDFSLSLSLLFMCRNVRGAKSPPLYAL